MAQFTFSNNTYAGSELAGFMASTLLEADSVQRGLWTVIQDVKARKVILDVDDDVVLQNPSGVFNDQGTTATQTESYLDPVVYEFMKQEQWDKLIQSWEVAQVKSGSLADYEGVVDLRDFLVERYIEKLAIANERLYYLGKTNTLEATFTAAYAGLLPTVAANGSTYKITLASVGASMAASAIAANGVVTVASTANLLTGDVVTINGVTGAIVDNLYGAISGQSYFIQVIDATTFKLVRNYNEINKRRAAAFTGTSTGATVSFINASNVLNVLAAVYAQLDYADRSQPDFNLQIPKHVGYAYAIAQANKATNVLNAFVLPKQMDYLGIPLQIMNHWQANTIMGARSSNLFLGVDLLSDDQTLKMVYLGDYTNDQVVKTRARMKSCVNAKFFNEILYLSA
jgi:hypothetical protein